ncbi:MAG: hypothetical protein ACOX2Q_08630 [Dehalobacterium sp.]
MGLLSLALLISGGTSALQTSVIVCGLPILDYATGDGRFLYQSRHKSSRI